MNTTFLAKANRNLNLNDFNQQNVPIEVAKRKYVIPHDRQYILRMTLRTPESNGLRIPNELDWLKDTILELDGIQKANNLTNEYVYVTVRHGLVTSETDDVWHVDGFSMRIPHLPEQNYIWTDVEPTEYTDQAFDIPKTFNPSKHHLHWYFDDRVKNENVKRCSEETIYLIDPYCIHRRPKSTVGMTRTFWRISFIPIEIQDGKCQQNPLLPIKQHGNFEDIRNHLTRFLE